jgi:hypothetical protein
MWKFGTWHSTCSDVQECNNHVRDYLTSQATSFVNAKQWIYRRKCSSKIHKSNHLREYFKRRSPSAIFMLTSQLECLISRVLCSCTVFTQSPIRSQVLYRKVDYCPEFVLTLLRDSKLTVLERIYFRSVSTRFFCSNRYKFPKKEWFALENVF